MKIHTMSQKEHKHAFFCPGCGFAHWFKIGGGGWTWNGDRNKPTITPSVLAWSDAFRCHSYITDGRIRFLSDCTHNQKGQTMELPEFPGSVSSVMDAMPGCDAVNDLFERTPSALPPVPLEPLLCLSIRQPWAYMILHHGKDIENRTWPTNVRGRILIHASKGMTHFEWENAWNFAAEECGVMQPCVTMGDMLRGGIVGSVEIVDCVQHSDSPWFVGPWGFVLRNPQPLEFMSCRGQLGWFRPATDAP